MTLQKLQRYGREVFMHSVYSSDPASSEYPLFHSLQNFLNDVRMISAHASALRLEIPETLQGCNYSFATKNRYMLLNKIVHI